LIACAPFGASLRGALTKKHFGTFSQKGQNGFVAFMNCFVSVSWDPDTVRNRPWRIGLGFLRAASSGAAALRRTNLDEVSN
jgi:hypothetical protein